MDHKIDGKKLIVANGIAEIHFQDIQGILSKHRDIEEIYLPTSLKTICSHTFFDFPTIRKIHIPQTIQSIGAQAFWGLDDLEELFLPITVEHIEKHAFCNCKKLILTIAGKRDALPHGWNEEFAANVKELRFLGFTVPKYPILLVHGMGFRDYKYIGYWGRIPGTLENMGCQVFFGQQDSNADIETNGRHLARRIEEVLQQTGAEKVNIIAHSKGGLDSRYAISVLGMGSKVASLTTVATPHHGSKTVDKLMKLPDPLIRFVGKCTDLWFRVLGDKSPNSYRVFQCFTTGAAEKFNADTPDHPGVLYQSYAFVMKNPFSDILMWLPNLVVGSTEGENDGLLTPDSVKWGNFRGIYRGSGNRGISHCDEIDLRRRPLSKKSGNEVSDMVDFYKSVVQDLAKCGF